VDATKNNKICTILFMIFWFDSSMEFYFSFLVSPCMFPWVVSHVLCPHNYFITFLKKYKVKI
jgi:hypothetical protein